jgi:hypothetical protein
VRAGVKAVVSRRDRVRDRVALGLIIAGVALYAYGVSGMRAMTDHTLRNPIHGSNMLEYAVRYYASYAGLLFAVIGVVLAIVSFMIHVRRTRVNGQG